MMQLAAGRLIVVRCQKRTLARRDAVRQRLRGIGRLALGKAALQARPAERAGELGHAGVATTGGGGEAGTAGNDAGIGFRLGADQRGRGRQRDAGRRTVGARTAGPGKRAVRRTPLR